MYVDFPILLLLAGVGLILLRVESISSRCKSTYTLQLCLRKEVGEIKQRLGVFMSNTKTALQAALEAIGVMDGTVTTVKQIVEEIAGDIQELKNNAEDPETEALAQRVLDRIGQLNTSLGEAATAARNVADVVPEPEPEVPPVTDLPGDNPPSTEEEATEE